MPTRKREAFPAALLTAALLALFNPGCASLMRAGIGASGPFIEDMMEAANRSDDPDLMREGAPAHLMLLDGLIASSPNSHDLLVLAAKTYCGYALAFVEEDDPEWATRLYTKGRDYGMEARKLHTGFRRALEGDVSFEEGLGRLGLSSIEAIFWTANSWAGLINLNLKDPMVLFDLPSVLALMNRVKELDHTYYYGGAHLFFGMYYASQPAMLGGGPAKAKPEFDTLFAINGDRFLMGNVFYARYYATAALDRALFESELEKVIAAPADALPEARLLNEIAKRKARKLLDEVDSFAW